MSRSASVSMSLDTPTSRAYSNSVVSQWSGKMVGLSHALLDPELPDGDLLDKFMQQASQCTRTNKHGGKERRKGGESVRFRDTQSTCGDASSLLRAVPAVQMSISS